VLNARRVAKCSDFGPFWGLSKAISRKRFTSRKSCMSFRLVPKSVTLNDLELRNGPYFALFRLIRVRCRKKSSRSLFPLLVVPCFCLC